MDLLGNSNERGSVLGVVGAGEVAVLLKELRESLETDVESSGAVPLGEIGDEELGLSEGVLEGFLLSAEAHPGDIRSE